jgi:hypothetical protein
MRETHRVLLGVLVARIAFGVLFLVSAMARWPVPWYLPIERRWVFAPAVRELGMDWYGRSGVSLALALASGVGAWALAGRPRWGGWLSRAGVLSGAGQLAALLLLQDVLWYAFTLMTRPGNPLPVP